MERNRTLERLELATTAIPEKSCYTCGLLCKVGAANRMDPRERFIEEATAVNRGQAELFELFSGGGCPAVPHCFGGVANLSLEATELALAEWVAGEGPNQPTRSFDQRHLRSVITKERRDCDMWTEYHEYLSPQVHMEHKRIRDIEQMRSELGKDRREWTERLEQDRRDWSERLDRQKSTDAARERHLSRLLAYATVGLSLVQVACAFLAPMVLRAFGL